MLIHKICHAFEEAEVSYAVVGGYAVALHGAPRGTVDIDFVVSWTLRNLEKVEEVLKKLGLISAIPVDAKNMFAFRDEYVRNRHLIAWHFFDPANPLYQVDIVINYDLKNGTTKTIKTAEGKIKILSRTDLIAMKKASGRPQDIEDVKSLEFL